MAKPSLWDRAKIWAFGGDAIDLDADLDSSPAEAVACPLAPIAKRPTLQRVRVAMREENGFTQVWRHVPRCGFLLWMGPPDAFICEKCGTEFQKGTGHTCAGVVVRPAHE